MRLPFLRLESSSEIGRSAERGESRFLRGFRTSQRGVMKCRGLWSLEPHPDSPHVR
jgi:hypothetical protein